jgi:hypothetical protein
MFSTTSKQHNTISNFHPFGHVTPPEGHPFLIENRMVMHDKSRGDVRADARVIVTQSLRTSGLLASLSDRESKLILTLLTYVTTNGYLLAHAPVMARDLGISEGDLQKQLEPLTKREWNAMPLVREIRSPQNPHRYTLSAALLGKENLGTTIDLVPNQPSGLPLASKEEVIEMSRAKYGSPRAEVERDILRQMGISPEEQSDTPEGKARRGMRDAGLPRDLIEQLVTEFGAAACLRQVQWLPLREAKTPSRYLVAAIEGNYSPPRGAQRITLEEIPDDVENPLDFDVPDLEREEPDDLPTLQNLNVSGGKDV